MTREIITVYVLAFGFYYLGIIIRKIARPGKDSPPLSKQLLLGIPVSLIVVTGFVNILNIACKSASTNATPMLVTLGLITEHGMLMNERLSRNLQSLLKRD